MTRFVFYDLETTGAQPDFDRPLQFAAMVTNADFEPIEEPVVWYAQHPQEVLSHPAAVMTTGLLPNDPALKQGMTEAQLAQAIAQLLQPPDTCAVGFNNLRFDAPMLRFLFWRSLKPPYEHEFKRGNSKFDVLDAARAYRLLRPEGIQWPENDQGYPSLKLTDLSAANGLAHTKAHDALSDVEATVGLARLLKQANPRLWTYLLNARDKQHVRQQVDRPEQPAFVHTTSRIAADRGGGSVFFNLGQPEGNPNARLLWDARFDPEPWLEMTPESLAERRFVPTPADRVNDPEQMRLPVKELHINRVPAVFPLSILKEPDVCARMVLDRQQVLDHIAFIQAHRQAFTEKMQQAVRLSTQPFPSGGASEQALYQGFVPYADQQRLQQQTDLALQASTSAEQSAAIQALLAQPWQDERLHTLVPHFAARNFPTAIDQVTRASWQNFCREQLNPQGTLLADWQTQKHLPRDIPHMQALARLWLENPPQGFSQAQLGLLPDYLQWLEQVAAGY